MSRRNVILLMLLTVSQRATPQVAETKTNTESSYAVNFINDDNFSPKSISELFTTEKTFSTANPMIVSQSSSPVPPIQAIGQIPIAQFSSTPLPYSVQPSSSQSPYSSQSVEMQPAEPQQPTTPIPIQRVETSTQPQAINIETTQPSTPLNPESQALLNQIQSTPQNQIQNFPTYQPVPIIKSTSIHPIPAVYRATSSSALPPRLLKPKTTLRPTPNLRPPCSSYPQIRIRMSSSGGITNIALNPVSTTKKQTTKRPNENNKRQNRNDHDECVKSCGDAKKRICAAPAGTRPVDADTLRGFPSICHLACHNNFKNNKYEKLLDGRCGRLRTRIRPVDSNDKIKRTELNKLQYQIVHEPQTVIEFEPIT